MAGEQQKQRANELLQDRAMQGWLTDPPPPSRTYAPGEEHKWYKMMSAAHHLPPASDVTAPESSALPPT
jgi:hypothetical protein